MAGQSSKDHEVLYEMIRIALVLILALFGLIGAAWLLSAVQ